MDTRPLVITESIELLDDLLRVAAAAGVELAHAPDASSKVAWRSSSVVILDSLKARQAVAAGMPRRPGVVVVALDEPTVDIWEHCVQLGVERTLVLPAGEELLVSVLADAIDTGPGNGVVVATIGARGGAGSSVLAAAVAVRGLASGSGVLLADCDPWGAGLDLLLGLEADSGLRWADLATPAGRVPAQALHQALPSVAGTRREGGSRTARREVVDGLPGVLSVLAFDRDSARSVPSEVLDVVLDSCRRAGELVVVDVARSPDPAGDQALDRADLVVLVVPADVPACFAARRVIHRVQEIGSELGVVVRGPAPGGLGADDVAQALQLPLICQMRPQPNLARDLEQGRPPGLDRRSPLGRAAGSVLEQVGIGVRNSR